MAYSDQPLSGWNLPVKPSLILADCHARTTLKSVCRRGNLTIRFSLPAAASELRYLPNSGGGSWPPRSSTAPVIRRSGLSPPNLRRSPRAPTATLTPTAGIKPLPIYPERTAAIWCRLGGMSCSGSARADQSEVSFAVSAMVAATARFETSAINSSNRDRNSFRTGELFVLL
jgi:hypothetical protein